LKLSLARGDGRIGSISDLDGDFFGSMVIVVNIRFGPLDFLEDESTIDYYEFFIASTLSFLCFYKSSLLSMNRF
jgi:hypothetical protein